MCSWCWAFKPVLEQVDIEYPELERITVMGGLRGGDEVPMDDALMEMIRGAWERIESATGQPFNRDLWEKHRPLATTLPACKAVLTAKLMEPQIFWPYMVAMFQAYFTRAMDPSSRETHLQVAGEMGLNRQSFEAMLDSQQVVNALDEDLQQTQRFGITGFPSVVLSLKDQHNYLISPGYQSIEGIRRAINAAYEDAGVDFMRPESGIYS